jgi:hypothetical protein
MESIHLKESLFLISEGMVASFGKSEADLVLHIIRDNGPKKLNNIIVYQKSMNSAARLTRCSKNVSYNENTLYYDSKNLLITFFDSLKPGESFWITKKDAVGLMHLKLIREKLSERNNEINNPPKEVSLDRNFAQFF